MSSQRLPPGFLLPSESATYISDTTLLVILTQVVREELLAFALSKGRVEEPPPSRVVCATMLGHIAAAGVLDTRDWQASLLKKTTALCQVRATASNG